MTCEIIKVGDMHVWMRSINFNHSCLHNIVHVHSTCKLCTRDIICITHKMTAHVGVLSMVDLHL